MTPEDKPPRRKARRPDILGAEGPVERGKNTQPAGRSRKQPADPGENLIAVLSQKVVGQPAATRVIVPYIQMYQAGLAPEGRPVGVFLLLGPTGTGKTKTVEALAEVLHGTEKNVLKIDCGEFQMEHEVAKLIGAPPGYLGHRETQPVLSQQRLAAVTNDRIVSLISRNLAAVIHLGPRRLIVSVGSDVNLRVCDDRSEEEEEHLPSHRF